MVIIASFISNYLSRQRNQKHLVSKALNPTDKLHKYNQLPTSEDRAIEMRDLSNDEPATTIAGGQLPSKGLIEINFKDLEFRVDDDLVIIPKVSGKIPAGKITAIMGPTGW